jgi:hypothetical protein
MALAHRLTVQDSLRPLSSSTLFTRSLHPLSSLALFAFLSDGTCIRSQTHCSRLSSPTLFTRSLCVSVRWHLHQITDSLFKTLFTHSLHSLSSRLCQMALAWCVPMRCIRSKSACCLQHFVRMFRDDVQSYVRLLVGRTKPKNVVVCMIYYPDESRTESWAGPALTCLRYAKSHF